MCIFYNYWLDVFETTRIEFLKDYVYV